MKIHSNDIPQADLLEDVVKTVIAVSQGATSFQDIASRINKVDRQGRYYRRAAEILGFIKNERNRSVLTELGRQFLQTGATLRNPLLLNSVLNARIFQRLIAFFEINSGGATKEQLVEYLGEVTEDIGESMLPRRVMSLLSWVIALNLMEEGNGMYRLRRTITRDIPILSFAEVDEPILPHTSSLEEYKTVSQRASSAQKDIMFYKDQAKLDRADNAHRHLVNLVAEKIRRTGNLPRCNEFIDLAARIADIDYLFEMKSTTAENVKSQIRRAISQLYEYRYLQNLSGAHLVLVIEDALPSPQKWMYDYLESDRDIMLLWDGNDELYAHHRTRNKMSFLW